jgi:hydroxyacylglutathione hydrolase
MQLIFEQVRTGGDRNFGYLLGDRRAGRGVLIDPSYSPAVLVDRARDQGLTITHIINTHSHPDHTNGNAEAAALTGAPVTAHALAPTTPGVTVTDGETLTVGALGLFILHVPGHCADHLVIYEPTYGILLTGDLLFVGKVGGTSNEGDARTEFESLRRLREDLPDTVTVWPGHDYGARPSSTMAWERQTNPFLRCETADDFLALKREWPVLKNQLGLK